MIKILYGLKDNKIIVVDADTSNKAKKQCFKEGCTSVIVADKTDEAMKAFVDEMPVSIDIFKDVEL